jgi:outer membrane protein OmpA-like peptidoglycan-associated protein
MIFKKWAFLALATVLACVTFADAQQRAKSRKVTKPKQAAKAAATQTPTQPADPKKAESPSPQSSPEAAKTAAQPGEIERITVDELKEKIAKHEPVTIIDSRSQGSYDATATKIKGAIRIPADDLQARLKDIPRDKEVVVYCT